MAPTGSGQIAAPLQAISNNVLSQELIQPRYCTYPFGPKDGIVQDAQGPCDIKGDWFGPYQTRWIPAVSNEMVAAGAVVLIFLTQSWLIKGARADQGAVYDLFGHKTRVKRYEGASGYTLKL